MILKRGSLDMVSNVRREYFTQLFFFPFRREDSNFSLSWKGSLVGRSANNETSFRTNPKMLDNSVKLGWREKFYS